MAPPSEYGLLAELGVKLPVIVAPMAGGPSTPELVLAAARAGSLGFLAAGYKAPEQLVDQIQQVRAGTARFGVNLFVPTPVPVRPEAYKAYRGRLMPWAQKYGVDLPAGPQEDDDAWEAKLAVLEEHPVPVVSLTFGLPSAGDVRRVQLTGAKVLQTVTSVTEAEHADVAGVDGLIVQSHEAGGHSGTWTPSSPAAPAALDELLLHIRATTDLPLWGAGGIARAERVREVRSAGAEAVVVGTALLRSPESGASVVYKAALADPQRGSTLITTAFSGRPALALQNEFTESLTGVAPLGFPALHHLTTPLRKAAAAAGDPEGINMWAGTGWQEATEDPAGVILRRLAG